MAQRKSKTVLFLGTGNHYRSRFAEILFNSVAGRLGLPWKAISRGLALDRSVKGPMLPSALDALKTRGIRDETVARSPIQATDEDLSADWIVALHEGEHRPLLKERFPDRGDVVEFWDVDRNPEAFGLIEREIMELTIRLLSGRKREGPPPTPEPIAEGAPGLQKTPDRKTVARVGRETKGRRGKGVTTVSDLGLDETDLLELAAKLKERCGSGGTVRDGVIEIQGDQRERVSAALEAMGYRVKRVGG